MATGEPSDQTLTVRSAEADWEHAVLGERPRAVVAESDGVLAGFPFARLAEGLARGGGALAYVVSKEAIVHFTDFHAEEVRDANICVVILSPGGTIATEDAPEEARGRLASPELAGPRFTLAAQAPMEMSGHLLNLEDDRLVVLQ